MTARQIVLWSKAPEVHSQSAPQCLYSTYKRCPRKYCRQSRHGKGPSVYPLLPACLASPSDAPHPRTQRTSCGGERREGSETEGPGCCPKDRHQTIVHSIVSCSVSGPPRNSLCWYRTQRESDKLSWGNDWAYNGAKNKTRKESVTGLDSWQHDNVSCWSTIRSQSNFPKLKILNMKSWFTII